MRTTKHQISALLLYRAINLGNAVVLFYPKSSRAAERKKTLCMRKIRRSLL